MTLFALIMPFTFFLLMDLLHLPSLVKYTVDIAWLGLLISLLKYRNTSIDALSSKLAIIAGVFFAVSLIGFAINYQSPLYYLWGFRNNARFFVFFFACIFFLKEHSVEYYLRFFDAVFWINFPVVLYQYFVLNKTQDYLGGIFGVQKGCNAYTIIFSVIIVAKSMLSYMSRKERLWPCLSKCAASLLIAALAELKFYFLIFIVIVIMATVITGITFKKVLFVLAAFIGVVFAIEILIIIFPEYAEWFNLETILSTAASTEGYTASGDMNRLTTVSVAFERFLPTSLDKIFGLGLGNCDYSSLKIFTTPFYMQYGRLNYVWFQPPFWF